MKNDFGFLPSKLDDTQYVFGASMLPKDILQADGNWLPYLPQYESQAINFDTYDCVIFGTLNAIETMERKLFNTEPNYSERYISNLAFRNPPMGSDPHTISEIIRKSGVIKQELLPMPATLSEYQKPRPMTKEYIDKGMEWLEKFDFKHEWVWSTNPPKEIRLALLKETLQYSPVCLSVTAWYPPENNLYVDRGQPNTHWVMCFALEGESPVIFDSYDQSIKRLHPDHQILMAKRIHLSPKMKTKDDSLNWVERMIKIIAESLGFIAKEVEELPKEDIIKPMETKSERLYNLAMSLKGKYLTCDTSVPKQFNCCQCCSFIFKEFGLVIPARGISGTVEMDGWLQKNMTEIKEEDFSLGDIFIAITQGNNHGHIFINGKKAMLSNDSDSGTLQSYWTFKGALDFYKQQKGLVVKFYRL